MNTTDSQRPADSPAATCSATDFSKDFSIVMAYDAFRAALGSKPAHYKPDDVMRWIMLVHPDSVTAAKLSERKTVHEWLNETGIPTEEETGKPMCLLRRLAVALGRAPHSPNEKSSNRAT